MHTCPWLYTAYFVLDTGLIAISIMLPTGCCWKSYQFLFFETQHRGTNPDPALRRSLKYLIDVKLLKLCDFHDPFLYKHIVAWITFPARTAYSCCAGSRTRAAPSCAPSTSRAPACSSCSTTCTCCPRDTACTRAPPTS